MLPRTQEPAFKQRILNGPTAKDQGVCTLRAKDAMRIVEQEVGVQYSLDGVYDLMHRLGLSCLKPRPRHRKNDPQAMQQWFDAASQAWNLRTHQQSKSICKTEGITREK